MIENYTRLSSRMFTATVVGKDKNGRKITEGRETYKTPSGVYEIKDWARLVEKAAVKGRHTMSALEADRLIDQLLDLDNPYACPHGRPTIISMSRYELEKKFKRIV